MPKKLRCKLGIHFPRFDFFDFRDAVSGKTVNRYWCTECQEKWMANNKFSFFKVYLND